MSANPLRVVFAGTPDFAVETLRELIASSHEVIGVYTQPDRPAGRGQQTRQSPVKQLAVEAGLEVFQPESLKTNEASEQLRALKPDIMIVVAYGQILPAAILEIPEYGCLNVHASLLPRWRGAAPIHRAILAGDETTGVTIMQMDEGLDTGDMLSTVVVPINDADNSQSLHDRLALAGAEDLVHVVDAIAEGSPPNPVQQQDDEACYASKLEKAEANIDWSMSSRQIFNAIRAFNPWPVAYTDFQGKPLRVWSAEIVEESSAAQPGEVKTKSDQLLVATADGWLSLLELQPAGKKRMTGEAFLNSRREIFKSGYRFGG